MRAKIIKKLPAPSNFFDAASVYSSMKTLGNNLEVKRMIKYLSFLFWPFSPRKLQPIKVAAPTSDKK
jgi:hypothetical protein